MEVKMKHLAGPCSLCLIVIVSLSLTMLSGCTTPEGNADDGKRWYRMHNCHACHGEYGYDGDGPDIAALDMSYRSFVHRLRNAETAVMPEFSEEKINDQDAADILAYLQNIDK